MAVGRAGRGTALLLAAVAGLAACGSATGGREAGGAATSTTGVPTRTAGSAQRTGSRSSGHAGPASTAPASTANPFATSTTTPSAASTTPAALSAAAGADPVLVAAYRHTVATGTARVSVSNVDRVAGTTEVTTVSGLLRWRGPRAALTERLPAALSSALGPSVAVRLVGATFYFHLPAADRRSAGASWIGITGFRFGQGSGLGADPAGQLALLDADATSVTRIGAPDLAGVPTTEYRATLDVARSLATAGPSIRALLRSLRASNEGPTQQVLVWVDGDGRVRQIVEHATVDVARPGAAPLRVVGTTTLRYGSFGVPVHVTAPPASETRTIPFSAYARLLRSAAAG